VTETQNTEELVARTILWKKLTELVDVVLPLLKEAVNQAHKVQREKRG
jgi:hypothetical protein